MRIASALLGILLAAGAFTTVMAQSTVPVQIPEGLTIDRSVISDLDYERFSGSELGLPGPTADPKSRLIGTASIIEGADSVGTTGYDFQTNGVMPRRIINWGRNGVQPAGVVATAIAMAADQVFPTTPLRGTHGAVLADLGEGNRTWLPINLDKWERLEGSRSGFCDIDYFKGGDFAGQVVAVSHANDLQVINLILETEAGSGDYFVIPVPNSDGGLWPRIAIDGNDVIHVIWTYQGLDGTPDGREGIMSYTRTTDQGTSWEPPIDFTGTAQGQLREVTGGDGYQIAANGSNVAIWYLTRGVEILQLYHNNNGDRAGGSNLWQVGVVAGINNKRIYSGNDGRNDDSVYYRHPQGDSVLFISDTLVAPINSFDMIVLDDGTVAGVYPEFPVFIQRYTTGGPDNIDTTQTTYLQGFIMQGGLPDFTDNALRFKHVRQLYDETPELETIQSSTIMMPEGLGPDATFNSPRGSVGYSRWPQMAVSNTGDLFATFGSAKAGDTRTVTLQAADGGDSVVNFYYSHVYAVRSTNNGATWTAPQDLTPDGVDAQFPSVSEWIDDEVHLIVQSDDFPGDVVTTEAEPTATTTGGNKSHPLQKSNFEVLSYLTTNFAPTSVLETYNPLVGGIDRIAPNPVSDRATVSFDVLKSGEVSMRVVDPTGRIVRRVESGRRTVGTYETTVDLDGIPAGPYRLVLTVDGTSTSRAINVIR